MPKVKRERAADPQVRDSQIFDADEAITFQISVLSNLIARPFYAAVGRHAAIALNDWRLMIAIANHPGISQAEIVQATGFNKSNVSRQLNNLHKYVRLEPHPVDNRKQAVYLTEAGWETYRQGIPSLLWRQRLLAESVPADELAQFQKTLHTLIVAAREWEVMPQDDAAPAALSRTGRRR